MDRNASRSFPFHLCSACYQVTQTIFRFGLLLRLREHWHKYVDVTFWLKTDESYGLTSTTHCDDAMSMAIWYAKNENFVGRYHFPHCAKWNVSDIQVIQGKEILIISLHSDARCRHRFLCQLPRLHVIDIPNKQTQINARYRQYVFRQKIHIAAPKTNSESYK